MMDSSICKNNILEVIVPHSDDALIEDLYDFAKTKKTVKVKKNNSLKYTFTFTDNKDKSDFIKTFINESCNYIIFLLCCDSMDKIPDNLKSKTIQMFFDEYLDTMTYFHELYNINMNSYLKNNETFNLQLYMKYNCKMLKQEIHNLFHSDLFINEIMGRILETVEEDDNALMGLAKDFKKVVDDANLNEDRIDTLHVFVEDYTLLIEDDKGVVYSSVAVPDELISMIDVDSLSEEKYIPFMISIFAPKKFIVYGEIQPGINEKIEAFYKKYKIELFPNTELYFSDEEKPDIEEDII